MKHRLWAAALAALVVFSMAFGALAQAQKDEVIYARLNADGGLKAVYVVNQFEANEKTAVTDAGDYASVHPLGQVDGFAYKDGKAAFTMEAGRFSYQGEPVDAALPWVFAITYTLDGQAVAPDRLPGASGLLEGRIAVTINESLRAFADSLSLQITVTLDAGRCLDIVAEKATLAAAGGNRSLSFVVLPGQEADYTFSARVKDFALPAIQAAGVRMGMDTEMYQAAAAEALAGSPLEGAVSGLMGNFLTAMQGRAPQSFTDAGNPVRSVQFVMMIDGIPEAEKGNGEALPEEKQTFWERLMGLFGQ